MTAEATVTEVARRLRLPGRVERALSKALDKVFPSHWSFLLGEIALFSFIVLVVTGIYLAFFYEASSEVVVYDGSYEPLRGVEMSRAYESVMYISFEAPAGLLARQVHHWAALVFVAAVALHAMRIFFTGAFRRPRRLNWLIGVTLLALALAAGFFGLALPHDLLGGTGTRISYAFAVSVPVVGPGLASWFFGGEFDSPGMQYRMWQVHVIVLPIIIGLLLATHLALVFLQTHTQFASRRHRTANVVGTSTPGYATKTLGLFLIVTGSLIALGALVQIAPIWLYGPFDATAATVPAQPDWYLGWVEGALRVIPGVDIGIARWEIPNPFISGVLLPLVIFAVLYAWPFLEERVTRDCEDHHLLDRPRDRPMRTAIGVAGLTFLGVLLLAGSHDLQGLLLGVSVDAMTDFYRVVLVLAPPLAGVVAYRVCRDLVRNELEIAEAVAAEAVPAEAVASDAVPTDSEGARP